jgi:hypothetical protein
MTTVKIEMDGLGQLLKQLQAIGENADDVVIETINDIATDTHALAVAGISHSGGGGRTYEKYKPRRTHTSSAPGAYPASDLGQLATNVRINGLQQATLASMAAVVGTSVLHGAWLEFGTSKMAARPWLLPSFKQAKIGVDAELRARLEGLL